MREQRQPQVYWRLFLSQAVNANAAAIANALNLKVLFMVFSSFERVSKESRDYSPVLIQKESKLFKFLAWIVKLFSDDLGFRLFRSYCGVRW